MSLPSPQWDPLSASFRTVYLTLLPSLLLLLLPPVFSLFSHLLPSPLKRVLATLHSYVGEHISLAEIYPEDKQPKEERPRWKTIVLVGGALLQLQSFWLSPSWRLEDGGSITHRDAASWAVGSLLAASWIYAGLLPLIVRRRSTPFVPLLAFYVVQLIGSSLTFLTALYIHVLDPSTPFLPTSTIVSEALALVVDLALMSTSLSLSLSEVPQAYVEDQKKLLAEGSLGYSPEDQTSFGSWFTFGWVYPLVVLGRSGYLKDSDLFLLSPVNASKPLFAKFALSSKLSLAHRVVKANGMDMLLDFSFSYLSIILTYAAPFFVKQIIEALGDPTPENLSKAYTLAGLALLASLAKGQTDLNKLWRGRRACIRINTQIAGAIFEKALVRQDASGVGEGKGASGVGKIMQLLSSDAPRIAIMAPGLSFVYGAPLELLVCCTFLYSILSWSAFAGVAAIILLMPLQAYLTSLGYTLQHKYKKASDNRTNLLSELINSIKIIKYFGWEQRWLEKVDEARGKELKLSVLNSVVSLVFSLSGTLTPMIVTVVAFFCYVQIQKQELTVAVAFTSLSLFGMLESPLTNLPMFIIHITQTFVCTRRVDAYLAEEEVSVAVSSLKSASLPVSTSPTADTRIGFVGARFKWNSGTVEAKDKAPGVKTNDTPDLATAVAEVLKEPRVFELGDIDFIFPSGALTVVSGPTGSGKTALLLSLLGETDIIKGSILLPKEVNRFDDDGLSNSIAYAGQTSWLQNLSIKGNILFGSPLDEERYTAVLKACSLITDLDMLEDGDETEIGSKGVSLSGGQKARVALARAIYSRAKHVLLDDPLAAVDSHTAAALVSDCLASPLLKNRTVIIVSHHIELLLPIAHSVVHVVDGRIEAQGTIAELRANGHLSAIVAEVEKAHVEEETVVDETPETKDFASEEEEKPKKIARKMTEDEDRAKGVVGARTYKVYLEAASWGVVAAIASLMILCANAPLAERWWISIWTRPVEETLRAFASLASSHIPSLEHSILSNAGQRHASSQHTFAIHAVPPSSNGTLSTSSLPEAKSHPLWYLGIYLAISFSFVLLDLIRNLFGYLGKYNASKKLHAKLVRSVIRATPRFFDVTPTGRILNRFTKDMSAVDDEVLDMITMVSRSFASVGGSLILVFAFLPAFIVPTFVLGFIYYRLTVSYLRCGRDLQRIKAVTLSPILTGFDSTLTGIVTVRAFSAELKFLDDFHEQQDKTTTAEWQIWMLNRWLLLRFDALGALTVFVTTVMVLGSGMSAALGGMLILASQSVMMSWYWACRFWSEMEMSMNSVDRVDEFFRIPQEARLLIPETTPPAYWPSNSGESLISVKDLVISYDPTLPPVIHGISFDVKPREKIGLIGRTGSGKSTLGMSFLRFTEFTSGSISIDGIDISTIGLQNLREKVSIIPQDAVLFSGTIRSNLDPFQEHTDEELIAALHRVQLGLPSTSVAPSRAASTSDLTKLNGAQAKDDEEALKANSVAPGGKIVVTLDSEVSAGGQNFSQGQRQLIALGRALLRNNLIVILDEATASVDFETDLLIQQTIREEFTNSCLLTIAHRLSSIVDYDRLLVLEAGRVVEFDTPFALLSKKEGVFKGMAEKSGKFDELLESAEKKEKST